MSTTTTTKAYAAKTPGIFVEAVDLELPALVRVVARRGGARCSSATYAPTYVADEHLAPPRPAAPRHTVCVEGPTEGQHSMSKLPSSPLPLPPFQGPTDVRFQVTACGICHSDLHLMKGEWGPFASFSGTGQICGHEVVGKVVEVGADVTAHKVGSRVGTGWYRGSCGSCRLCMAGEENACPKSVPTCAAGNKGGFAHAMVVPADFALPLPDNLSDEAAAPLLCGGITVWTPLTKYGAPGARVGVVGIGGLGSMAIQLAAARGCVVTAISTSADKEELAASLGASNFLVSSEPEQVKAAENSLDLVIFTVAASDADASQYISLLRTNGVLSVVGATMKPVSVDPFGALILKQITVTGNATGGRGRIVELLQFAADKKIQPLVETFPVADVNAALAKVDANKVRFRAVLKI
jgi:alcohol/geraniol dehydrogenase (NADP+)